MKSNEEYVFVGGNSCPFCVSINIESTESPQCDSRGELTQMIECHDCGRAWTDIYALKGYKEVKE